MHDEAADRVKRAWLRYWQGPKRPLDPDFMGRDLCITAYEGCYGQAGAVVTVNGSPPRATMLVETHAGADSRVYLVLPWYPHTVKVLYPGRPVKGKELRAALFALLQGRGLYPGRRAEYVPEDQEQA